jgi:hypothetical protein
MQTEAKRVLQLVASRSLSKALECAIETFLSSMLQQQTIIRAVFASIGLSKSSVMEKECGSYRLTLVSMSFPKRDGDEGLLTT